MAKLTFPAYGSIYFANSALPTTNTKLDLGKGFCLGPSCGPLYWNSAAGESELYGQKNTNNGPWPSIAEFCAGLIDTGRSRIPKYGSYYLGLPYHGSRSEHIKLLAETEAILTQLMHFPPILEAGLPTLLHHDLRKRNIYVSDLDPAVVTGIIDWQSTSVEPGSMYANEIPDFTTFNSGSPFSAAAVTQNQPPFPESDQQSRDRKDAKICHTTYEGSGPDAIATIPPRATSWRDSATSVRQELINVSQKWQELGLPGECSYWPSEGELKEHQKHYQDFETAQELKSRLMDMLNTTSDGWVPNDAAKPALAANLAALDEWMKSAVESGDMSREKAEELWPFNEALPI
ncbi:uncharacterized protein BP5553_10094 [Venustampulla echinocandica]|uniref:Aminoglycoside phosphotransferase domain-containing protein n=1 Tax=Venustampulla echinocandica TaxID=2656787 RepID=A0A370TAC1_9HELO|nr:uncharacterized protein BP5553_10094 [Venustampulla echinocandica]RDL30749.1 hypothetical protein BP5553_10094 [Venustampulla echinocandica]